MAKNSQIIVKINILMFYLAVCHQVRRYPLVLLNHIFTFFYFLLSNTGSRPSNLLVLILENNIVNYLEQWFSTGVPRNPWVP